MNGGWILSLDDHLTSSSQGNARPGGQEPACNSQTDSLLTVPMVFFTTLPRSSTDHMAGSDPNLFGGQFSLNPCPEAADARCLDPSQEQIAIQ
jgi:hypothetical protein